MSQDVTAVIKFVADDQTAGAFSSANRSLKNQEKAIQRVVDQQKKLTREAGKSADQIAIETLKRSGAKDEIIAQVVALQEERQAILQAKTARKEGINEVDRMIAAMRDQAATIGMSKAALAEHKAVQQGATAAQLASIQAIQAEIDAKQQETQATIQTSSAADQLIQKLQTQINTFDMSEDAVLEYKLRLDGATDAQIAQIAGLQEQSRAMQKQIPLYQRMKQQLRFIRGGFGQVGHQVQDIAVQLQGGTDAMIVFGQQGSQIASLFGPGGAAIGALLAVGAAAYTVFKNFELSSNEIAELREELKEFEPKSEAARESLARTQALLTASQRNILREEIEELSDQLNDAAGKGLLAIERYKQIGHILADEPKAELIETIQSAGLEAQTAETRLFKLRDELIALGGAVTDFPEEDFLEKVRNLFADPLFGGREIEPPTPEVDTSAAEAAAADFLNIERTFLTGIKKINSDFDLIKDQIVETAELAGIEGDRLNQAIQANEAARQAALDKFHADEYAKQVAHSEALRQERLAREAAIQEIEDEARQREKDARQARLDDFEASLAREEALLEEQKNMRISAIDELMAAVAREDQYNKDVAAAKVSLNQQVLSSAQSLTQGLLAGMNKESSAYKAVFAAAQALAIAQTVINTEMAAIAALAPPPVGLGPTAGLGYSKAIRAIGYASVGLIAAQTVSSFEGGGFTGRGSRSGGIDGRGGFPAILHPNETVIDHDGGGMQPIVVNQTINVTTGVQQTVRAEIANLLPQISEAAKSAVADSRMRGGNFGGAMGA